jgi:hypothetical protein
VWIFDRGGTASLLLSLSGRIFTPDGVQVGWLDGAAVFSRQARQVGWFSGGLLRDLTGGVVGFAQIATDTTRPALPTPNVVLGVLSLPVATTRPTFPAPTARPADRPSWSAVGPAGLFSPEESR